MKKSFVFCLFLTTMFHIYADVLEDEYRLVDAFPNKRLLLPEIRKKIDVTTNLTELLPFFKEKDSKITFYAAHHIYKIPLLTIIEQKKFLTDIKKQLLQSGRMAECIDFSIVTGLLYEIENYNTVNDDIQNLLAIKTWKDMIDAMSKYVEMIGKQNNEQMKNNEKNYYNPSLHYLAFCTMYKLPIQDEEVQLFRDFIKNAIKTQSEEQAIIAEDFRLSMAVHFLAQSTPTQETINLLKELFIKTGGGHLQGCCGRDPNDGILVHFYNMNTPEADTALLEIFKEINKREVYNNFNLESRLLLCDMLRDAQIVGVTPYLKALSKDDTVELWLREEAAKSAEWREKNSKIQ